MELGICLIDPITNELIFAGARFFLWRFAGGEIEEINGDRRGIGYRRSDVTATFTSHTVPLAGGETFYMTSDGFIDQIGGEKRRSYGKRRLRESVLRFAEQSMAEQKERIYGEFVRYQGEETRRDDVTVFGFKPRKGES